MTKHNIGEVERVLRVILGIFAMLLGFLFIQGVAGIILGVLGLIAFLTGVVGLGCAFVLLRKEELPQPQEPASPEGGEEQTVECESVQGGSDVCR